MVHRGRAMLGVVALVVSLGVLGCQYPIAREYRLQAREDLTIPLVQANPEAYRGEIVIWGGTILETINRPGTTEVTVLSAPLGSGLDPLTGSHSEGRFIARIARFLDPEVYARGRDVTLAGQIAGTETRQLGEMQYAYPVVEIKQVYLWAEEEYYYGGHYYPGYYYYGPYGWPYYWWDPWYGRPYGHRRFR